MDCKQQEAFDLCLNGHNVLITGQAGTGKTFLLTEISRALKRNGKNVQVTSTTGIASTCFPKDMNASTVHRWSGLDDGRYEAEDTAQLIKSSPKFYPTLTRICNTNVLIVDEISMLSKKMFEQLEHICSSVRQSKAYFGGLQVILSGDFYQLPPVPNKEYNDNGELCFESFIFKTAVPHKVVLNKILRQENEELARVISETARGHLTEFSLSFLKSLDRPINDTSSVKLFSNNLLVDTFNRSKLFEAVGDIVEFKSVDEGEKRHLGNVSAQPTLWLKKGSPVILLRNISNVLVNGLTGTVKDFEPDGPVVEFSSAGITSTIKRTELSGTAKRRHFLESWKEVTGTQIGKSTVVCEKHFTKDDYTGWNPVRRRLNKGTVPTVFDWIEQTPKRRKLERKLLSTPEKSQCSLDQTAPGTSEEDAECDTPKFSAVRLQDHYQKEIETIQRQLDECAKLQEQLNMERFLVSRLSKDDRQINFYTGFSTYAFFLPFFQALEPTAINMQMLYYEPVQAFYLAGRKRNMLLIDEFFMFMCRLRVGLLEQDLSVRFNCSVPTVSRKIVTWVNFLYVTLGRIPFWLSRAMIDKYMPECFKKLYPKTSLVIDCTEIKTQHPASLVLNSQLYSHYKSACTFKCLIGVAPHGMVTFVSTLNTGCMSDVEITKHSGILDLLDEGDDVMADKGFTLRKILSEKGVTLNIPPFLSSKKHFSKAEIKDTEQIAKLRIHVERVNRRIKEFHLFDTPLPLSWLGSANQLWEVACMLSNFKGPIVQNW